ncbi:hypothetical protein GNP80_07400 [Aliivibrio fischeri]|uniref:glycosyltransferase n=1 Tax=Aliivibrio fischeri TaxID=668 RepID=UPI0012D9C5DC|nr:glycosyltransferase [Aliivibrio fischeri]MUK92262.1 hypothetical protein [Aliivibrio fischeri]
MSKKILYAVSGSWPPEICGVGDYMNNLVNSIQYSGREVKRITITRYSVLNLLKLIFLMKINKEAKVFMSYPTEGYGRSILPFMLCFIGYDRLIVHIHEYTSKNNACKKLLRIFSPCKILYFSNKNDFDKYKEDTKTDFKDTSRWLVIPTPSNITPIYKNNHNRIVKEIVHFGQIRPNKGLEKVLTLFKEINKNYSYNVKLKLVGGVPKGYETYANNIINDFLTSGVDVKLNLTLKEISNELANSDFGVFIFPDGADERRGSLIAALAHEVICFTNYSERTPYELKNVTLGIDESTSENMVYELYLAISSFLSQSERHDNDLVDKIIDYSSKNGFDKISKMIMEEF